MGKGLINIQPCHSDMFLQNNIGLGGLLTLLVTCTNQEKMFFGRFHTSLYYLVLSMYPRMMVTVSSLTFSCLTKLSNLSRSLSEWVRLSTL